MTKKITLKDWTYIGELHYAKGWIRPLCTHTLTKTGEKDFLRVVKIAWIPYLIMFIPLCVLIALWCMWEGGLVEFEFPHRFLGADEFHENWGANQPAYPRAKEIWEKYSKQGLTKPNPYGIIKSR